MESIGNIQITHIDSHGTLHYLTSSAKFTTNGLNSAAFYVLKNDNSPIYAGDAVTINCANSTLAYDNDDVFLVERDEAHQYKTKFIINQLQPTNNPIDYDQPLLLVTSVTERIGLQALWKMQEELQPELRLVNRSFSHLESVQSTLFIFNHTGQSMIYQQVPQTKLNFFEKHREYILLLLIVVILVLISISHY